ncbi:MAG: DNA polymerase III subunit beta [Myxococcota bacterium]
MKVRIDKAALAVPLYRAQGVVDRKTTTNVTACVHISAGEDGLTFSATDYDVTITAEASAEVMEQGAVLVNGRALFDVVRALPDESIVQLTSDDNHRLRIEAGRSYFHLNGIAPEEFPPSAMEAGSGKSLICDKSQVQAMLRRTLFSVLADDSRPALSGVLLEIEPEAAGQARLRMVSTDGHRLSKAERTVAATDYDGTKHRCIVHRRGAAELQRILDGSDPSVRIEFVGRNVVFSSDKARLQIRQIEESFPDYSRVIPERGDAVITLATSSLLSSIRRVSSLANNKDATLRVEIADGIMSLEMKHQDVGEAHEEIELPDSAGVRLKVGFNPRFLMEVCGVLETENITLEMSDQFSPCLVHSDEEPGSVFVIMPMRL